MILLTGEQQLEVLRKLRDKYRGDDEQPTRAMEDEALCKAQLKKVVEWLNNPCTEHKFEAIKRASFCLWRRQCPKCWQALLEEVKDV